MGFAMRIMISLAVSITILAIKAIAGLIGMAFNCLRHDTPNLRRIH